MSRYEWEAGTIKIPTRAWAPLKKALREAHNARREEIRRLAETAQKSLALKFKGKRNVPTHEVEDTIRRALGNCPEDLFDAADALVEASLKEGSTWRTNKITEAMLSKSAGPKATNKTLEYHGDEWDIHLDDKARRVRWGVDENNHSVERARESWMGDALFRELDRIDFGNRKEMGGVIVGNDEYNEDDDSVGGGGNYVTAAYGKAGEREQFGAWGRYR